MARRKVTEGNCKENGRTEMGNQLM